MKTYRLKAIISPLYADIFTLYPSLILYWLHFERCNSSSVSWVFSDRLRIGWYIIETYITVFNLSDLKF